MNLTQIALALQSNSNTFLNYQRRKEQQPYKTLCIDWLLPMSARIAVCV